MIRQNSSLGLADFVLKPILPRNILCKSSGISLLRMVARSCWDLRLRLDSHGRRGASGSRKVAYLAE